MHPIPKRKGTGSGQQVPATKRARWESEVAMPPSECAPTASGSALISGVQNAQIYGGTFTVAAPGSTHNQTTIHNYNYGTQQVPAEVLEFLNSLSLPNFRDIQLDTYAKATEGTCIWFTTGEIFLLWIAKGKILWGIGIPGAGKTIFASIVIRDLERREGESGGIICVAFIYLRYSEPLAVRDILGSLVKQILERHLDLVPIVEGLYAKHKLDRTKPSQQELMDVLAQFIKRGKSFFFVLDALDEMRVEDRPVLLRLLTSLDAKIFITSRPLEVVQSQFPQARVFSIAASPSDLNLHIKDFLRHCPEVMALLEGTEYLERIVETVHRKSGGMFLHAKLQLEALRYCTSAFDVEETLEAFPTDIEAIYMKTWERILAQGSKYSNLAKLALLWITHARVEMTIDALRRAIAISPEAHAFDPMRMAPQALLLSACCGLVSVDEKTKLVRLIHYTTRDAILPKVLELYPIPHAILAHVCIVHLTKCGFPNFSYPEGRSEETDFGLYTIFCEDGLLGYAHRSWNHHASLCGQHPPIMLAISRLVLNCTNFPLKSKGYQLDFGGPLHIAALHGLEHLIPAASRLQSPNVRTRNRGISPLMLATQGGRLTCTKALLSLPGIDANLKSVSGETALIQAAMYGHIQCIQLLVEVPGIDINAADERGWTAILRAVRHGHVETVKLLVALPDININGEPSSAIGTPLTLAALNGRTEIVELLIDLPGMDVNAGGPGGKTAFMHASSGGYAKIMTLLLGAPGHNINVRNWGGFMALMLAVIYGRIDMVKYLLGLPDIDINLADNEGRTPLICAVYCPMDIFKPGMAELLLRCPGIDYNARDNEGKTALIHAVNEGRIAEVKLFCELPGMDINAADKDRRWTALMVALGKHKEIFKLLVGLPGIDVNAAAFYGWTPLICAAGGGLTEEVEVLCKAPGIKVDTVNWYGQTALMEAASGGHAEVVKLFIELPSIDINVCDQGGWTALIYAAREGHMGVLKLLCEVPGLAVNAVDHEDRTALIHAVSKGHTEAAKQLLSVEGIDINVVAKEGGSALSSASRKGHGEIVDLLIAFAGN